MAPRKNAFENKTNNLQELANLVKSENLQEETSVQKAIREAAEAVAREEEKRRQAEIKEAVEKANREKSGKFKQVRNSGKQEQESKALVIEDIKKGMTVSYFYNGGDEKKTYEVMSVHTKNPEKSYYKMKDENGVIHEIAKEEVEDWMAAKRGVIAPKAKAEVVTPKIETPVQVAPVASAKKIESNLSQLIEIKGVKMKPGDTINNIDKDGKESVLGKITQILTVENRPLVYIMQENGIGDVLTKKTLETKLGKKLSVTPGEAQDSAPVKEEKILSPEEKKSFLEKELLDYENRKRELLAEGNEAGMEALRKSRKDFLEKNALSFDKAEALVGNALKKQREGYRAKRELVLDLYKTYAGPDAPTMPSWAISEFLKSGQEIDENTRVYYNAATLKQGQSIELKKVIDNKLVSVWKKKYALPAGVKAEKLGKGAASPEEETTPIELAEKGPKTAVLPELLMNTLLSFETQKAEALKDNDTEALAIVKKSRTDFLKEQGLSPEAAQAMIDKNADDDYIKKVLLRFEEQKNAAIAAGDDYTAVKEKRRNYLQTKGISEEQALKIVGDVEGVVHNKETGLIVLSEEQKQEKEKQLFIKKKLLDFEEKKQKAMAEGKDYTAIARQREAFLNKNNISDEQARELVKADAVPAAEKKEIIRTTKEEKKIRHALITFNNRAREAHRSQNHDTFTAIMQEREAFLKANNLEELDAAYYFGNSDMEGSYKEKERVLKALSENEDKALAERMKEHDVYVADEMAKKNETTDEQTPLVFIEPIDVVEGKESMADFIAQMNAGGKSPTEEEKKRQEEEEKNWLADKRAERREQYELKTGMKQRILKEMEEAREAYIAEFNKGMKGSWFKAGFLNVGSKLGLVSKDSETFTNAETKIARQKYEDLRRQLAFGTNLAAEQRLETPERLESMKKSLMERAKKNGESVTDEQVQQEVQKILERYRTTVLANRLAIEERQKIQEGQAVSFDTATARTLAKVANGWKNMKPWQRKAITATLYAGAGFVGGMGVGALGYATYRTARSYALSPVMAQLTHFYEKIAPSQAAKVEARKKADVKKDFAEGKISVLDYQWELDKIERATSRRNVGRVAGKMGTAMALGGAAAHEAGQIEDMVKNAHVGEMLEKGDGWLGDNVGTPIKDWWHKPHFWNDNTESDTPDTEKPEASPEGEKPATVPPVKSDVVPPEKPDADTPPADVPEKITLPPTTVDFGEKGSIRAFLELKENLKEQLEDKGVALDDPTLPATVREILDGDPTKLAIKYNFYNPEDVDESALVLKGDTLGFDKDFNLVYHEASGEETILSKIEGGKAVESGEFDDKYIDADGESDADPEGTPIDTTPEDELKKLEVKNPPETILNPDSLVNYDIETTHFNGQISFIKGTDGSYEDTQTWGDTARLNEKEYMRASAYNDSNYTAAGPQIKQLMLEKEILATMEANGATNTPEHNFLAEKIQGRQAFIEKSYPHILKPEVSVVEYDKMATAEGHKALTEEVNRTFNKTGFFGGVRKEGIDSKEWQEIANMKAQTLHITNLTADKHAVVWDEPSLNNTQKKFIAQFYDNYGFRPGTANLAVPLEPNETLGHYMERVMKIASEKKIAGDYLIKK